MATEKIGIEVEVKGAEKTISSFKDLKTAIKAAKDEQIAMTSKFGEGSIEATKAGQKLAGLKDKVEDLNDSTKTLKGSGIEKLTSSFRLLGEGLGTFDFDKIKLGFKGVGAAMGAIPIFLLIEGIKLLYDNFDKIAAIFDKTSLAEKALAEATKAVSSELAKVLEGVQNVEGAFDSFNKGTLSKDETLKIYNETLGDSLGYTNDLAIAESNFVANKDLYIEAMQAKSTANVLFAKSAEAQAKVLTGEAAGADAVPWYEKTYAYISSIGLNAQADMNEYANKVVEYGKIHSKETQQFADDTKKLGQTEYEKYNSLFDQLKTNNKIAGTLTKEEFDKAEKLRLKGIEDAKAAAQKRLEDEKKLLADIEKAKEESYIKTFKTEVAQAIVKAQFENDKLIEDINSSTASQAIKNKALVQAEITLQENYAQIQKDYKVKQDAEEKAAKEKKEAQDKIDEAKFLASQQSKASKLLSTLESAYQLELEGIENNDLLKLQKEQEHVDEVYRINVASANLIKESTTALDNKYAKDKIALEKKIAAETKKIKQAEIAQGFENVKNSLIAAQGLSDIYFTIKSAKVKGDAAKEEALARKQFNIQKAFNLAKVGMDGYMAISNIIATTPKADFGISTGILLAASAISTAANLAKIGAAQFEGGAAAPATSPESAASIPSTTSQAPAIYGPGQGQSTTFSGNQNNNFAPVKAYVVETENRSTTNRVNKLVSESTYG